MKNASTKPAKAVALIAEYNPFHNGHLSQIKELKARLGQDCLIIVVLSSYYCQRGIPAIMPPRTRAAVAVQLGADLVIKMPSLFSSSTAQSFASAGVSLISALPQIDYLAFGLEDPNKIKQLILASAIEQAGEQGSRNLLPAVNQLLINHAEGVVGNLDYYAEVYTELLKAQLSAGKSYPEARLLVLTELLDDPSLESSLRQPNHILAYEYISQVLRLAINPQKSSRSKLLNLIATSRQGADERQSLANNPDPATDTSWSAKSIREQLSLAKQSSEPKYLALKSLINTLPEISLAEILASPEWPDFQDLGRDLVQLLTRSSIPDLTQLRYWQGGLAERAKNLLDSGSLGPEISNPQVLTAVLSGRNFPITRVQRALISLLLNIREEDCRLYGQDPAFIEVLAFNKRGKSYLRRSRTHFGLPLISRFSELNRWSDPKLEYQARIERRAACLYFSDTEKGHSDLLNHALYLSPSEIKTNLL